LPACQAEIELGAPRRAGIALDTYHGRSALGERHREGTHPAVQIYDPLVALERRHFQDELDESLRGRFAWLKERACVHAEAEATRLHYDMPVAEPIEKSRGA